MPTVRRLWAFVSRLAVVSIAIAAACVAWPATAAYASGCDSGPALSALGLSPTVLTSGQGVNFTLWSGSVASWDGLPISVDFTVPATSNCSLPLISLNHGYGGDKTAFRATTDAGLATSPWTYDWNNAWFAEHGYSTLAMTARGFGDSCGKSSSSDGTAAGLPAACTQNSRHYWIQLDDTRYVLRDLQWVIGRLVDAGAVDPNRIGVGGGSMGGGLTWLAALLNDRISCGGLGWNPANGTDPCAGKTSGVAPWASPAGTPLHIAAAVPEFSWATMTEMLLPNGRASDGLSGAPAAGNDQSPVGIPPATWVSNLYGQGQSTGFFESTGTTDPTSDWGRWFQDLQQQVNTVTAASTTSLGADLRNAMQQWDAAKSPATPYLSFDTKVPVLAVEGMGDSIVKPVQAAEMWRKAKAFASDYPIAVVYADAGHAPATNESDVISTFNDRANAFLDYELRGVGSAPVFDTRVIPFRCGNGSALAQFAASDLAHLQISGVDLSSSSVQTTTNTTTGPEATGLAPSGASCPKMTTQVDPGVASWSFPVGTAQVVVGAPVVTLTLHSTAADAQLNVRLWDVANGTQTLMSRTTYRLTLTPGTTDSTVSLESALTGWRIASGHTIKVEVAGADTPTYQADSIADTTTIDAMKLHLPTTDLVGYGAGLAVAATEGTSFSGHTANFAGADSTSAGNYTATIDWGDGATTPGSVGYAGYGWYVADGTHTWSHAGTYRVTTTIASSSGVTIYDISTATIADAPLTAVGAALAPTAGQGWTGMVASVVDGNSADSGADLTATVSWGDGSASAASVSSDPAGGGLKVIGTHTYASAGTFAAIVTVTDVGGSKVSTTTTATVAAAPVSVTSKALAVSAGQPWSGQVATVQDPNANGNPANITATVDWGDGSASATTVSLDPAGGFDINAGHTYAVAGTFAAVVTATDVTGPSGSATDAVTVTASPLTVSLTDPAATAAVGWAGSLGTVEDPNPGATADTLHATVSWGDGSTSNATASADPAGGFDLTAAHTYAAAGQYLISVIVTDAVGGTGSGALTSTVGARPIAVTTSPASTSVGSSFSGVIATLQDPNSTVSATDINAVIDWGDGSATSGTVTGDSTSGFSVAGTHTYGAQGQYSLTVTVTDSVGSTGTASATATAHAASLVVTISAVNAAAGSLWSGQVAHVQDPNGAVAPASINATVTWGDGATSAGTVTTDAAGGYDISGTHTYATAGSYQLTVTAADAIGGAGTGSGSLTVSAQPLTVHIGAIGPLATVAWSGMVATLNDPNPGMTTHDITATIAWGDGSSSVGVVTADPAGGFDISGSHTYSVAGNYAIGVNANDSAGGAGQLSATIAVTARPLSITVATPAPIAAVQWSGNVATISDPNSGTAPSALTATIAWGDGTTSAGSVVIDPAGGFDVTASHVYATTGSYRVTVTASDSYGSNGTNAQTWTVTARPLSVSGQALSATRGTSWSGVVARATDPNSGVTASAIKATIDWGDQATSSATVVTNSTGGFNISGSHTYSTTGTFTVRITVSDTVGSTGSASTTATVTAKKK